MYEVLSPWANVDPISTRGIAPRITDLAGKTIGLMPSIKIAARPALDVVEKELRKRFPTSKFSWYPRKPGEYGQGKRGLDKDRIGAWLKGYGVDTVITAIGD